MLAAPRRELGGPHECHLGTHERPVGGVEGDEPVLTWITAGLAICPYEQLTEAFSAMRGEIEHQEREIVRDVQLAQRGIELHTIDNANVVADQYVLGPQVAVAVADPPVARARGERRGVSGDERVCEPLERLNAD